MCALWMRFGKLPLSEDSPLEFRIKKSVARIGATLFVFAEYESDQIL